VGFRFSKSFKVGSGRINLSKSGIGASIGTKGFRLGAGPRGAYTSTGIPGTGPVLSQLDRKHAVEEPA
jgi:hypothetical protein